MPQLMIVNPAKRRRASTKKRRVRAAPRRARRSSVRRNPISVAHVKRRIRRYVRRARANPITHRRRRIRRNPIGLGSLRASSIVAMLKDAAIGGAGAVGMDWLWDKISPNLPATVVSSVGMSRAVQAGLTVLLGRLLKGPTRGLSEKMAIGSLTVQAYSVIQDMTSGGMSGMGYMSPAHITSVGARVGPMQAQGVRRLGMNVPGYRATLRQALPGTTAVLNGVGATRMAVQNRGRIAT